MDMAVEIEFVLRFGERKAEKEKKIVPKKKDQQKERQGAVRYLTSTEAAC
jgi:hypothetical protein